MLAISQRSQVGVESSTECFSLLSDIVFEEFGGITPPPVMIPRSLQLLMSKIINDRIFSQEFIVMMRNEI